MKKGKGNFGKAKLLKRGLALLLAALMVESVTADTGLLYVSAREALTLQEAAGSQEAESGQEDTLSGGEQETETILEYRILGFETLSGKVQEQTLPLGAEETEIVFPDSLKVTARQILESGSTEASGEEDSKEAAEKENGSEEEQKKETEGIGGQGQTQEGSKEENKDGAEEGQEENGNGSEEGQEENENGSEKEQEEKNENCSGKEQEENENGSEEEQEENENGSGKEQEENKNSSEKEQNENGSEEGQGEKENGSGEEQGNQSAGNAASKQGAETAESTGESASIKGREPEANAVAGAAALWEQLTAAFRPMTAYAAEPESQKESEEQTKQQTIEAEQKVAKNSTGTGADPGRETGAEAGEETETNTNMAKKEGALVELTLTGIQWKLDPAESDFPQFDGSRNGAVYAYTPVLPEADQEGRAYVLSEDAKLPVIYVLVGEMQVMLLSGNELDINTLLLSTKQLSTNASFKEDSYGIVRIDSANQQTYQGKTLTGSAVSDGTKTGNGVTDPARGLIISSGVTLDLTIKNLTINREKFDGSYGFEASAIAIEKGATLNLTLEGDNVLIGGYFGAGICVEEGATLNITEKSTGSVKAVGGNEGGASAGIGACSPSSVVNELIESTGDDYWLIKTAGTICIQGGKVTANGGTAKRKNMTIMAAAGIGGSTFGTTGSIEIGGGEVMATGGDGGAGIGGGSSGRVERISITGGTVTADRITTSGETGAAIGSGCSGAIGEKFSCGEISITGGTVTAKGNIGYGDIVRGTVEGGSVSITGGTVEVTGKIDPATNVSQDYILHHYELGVIVYDPALADGTGTAEITIGAGTEDAYTGSVTLGITEGKAAGALQFASRLHGEQQVKLTINGTAYEEKTVDLDREKEILWGSLPGLLIKEQTCAVQYTNGVLTFSGDGKATVAMAEGTEATADQIRVKSGTLTLTLQDVCIDAKEKERSAIFLEEGAKVTLILQGKNKLTSYGQEVAVLDGSASVGLTICGEGSLTVTNETQKATGSKCGAGIKTGDVPLTFEGEPTVQVYTYRTSNSGKVGDNIAIWGNNITIHGGKISAASGRGVVQGIGNESTEGVETAAKVTITGGTIYGEGGSGIYGGGIAGRNTQAVITGGNVHMNNATLLSASKKPDQMKQPLNQENALLWCTTITVGGNEKSLSKEAKVLELVIQSGGQPYEYGIDEMYTDEEGKLYLWLPEGEEVTKVRTVNGTYTGSCVTEAKVVSTGNGSGTWQNYWGTATAAFSLQGETMFYPVQEIKLANTVYEVGEHELSDIATIEPEEATNKEIQWSITDQGQTGAEISGGKLIVPNPGTYQLTATVPNGAASDEDYTKTFTITIQAEAALTALQMEGWVYGETPKTPSYQTNSDAVAVIEYKKKGADNSAYSKQVPTQAGDYVVRITLLETQSYKMAQAEAEFTIARKELSASDVTVSCQEQFFTGRELTLKESDLEVKDGQEKLSFGTDYEIKDYLNNRNLSIGENKAQVTLAGIGNYTGSKTVPFQIVNKTIEAEASLSAQDWTMGPVTVSAPAGYEICREKNGNYDYEQGFATEFMVEKESASQTGESISYQLRDLSDQAVSVTKKVTVKIDMTAPSFEEDKCGIQIKENLWKRMLNTISFGRLYKDETIEVVIQAQDPLSGVSKYYYYEDRSGSSQVKTAGELDTLGFSMVSAQEGKTVLSSMGSDGKYVYYAYAVDQVGNRSAYICSDGVVIDRTKPELTLTAPASQEGTLFDTSAVAAVSVNEAGSFYYVISEDASRTFTSLEAIKEEASHKKGAVTEGQIGKPISLKLTELKPGTTYYLYAAASDPAENAGEVKSISFTTSKTIPYIEKTPQLSGVYGTALKDLLKTEEARVVSQKGSSRVLAGSWSVKEAEKELLPSVGTEKTYTLIFTPEGEDAKEYGAAVCAVKPVISKKQISVSIEPKTKTYGEDNPALTYVISQGALVAGEEESVLSITLTTKAAKNSDAGDYAITGQSRSQNYQVKFEGQGTLTITPAENVLTKPLTCADFIYDGVTTPSPSAEAKSGKVTYQYAKNQGNPSDSDFTAKKPVAAGEYLVRVHVAATKNYRELTSSAVSFTIRKAEKAPNMPKSIMSVGKQYETIGEVPLPKGWSFQEQDQNIALEIGVPVKVTAIYTGADQGNYQTESIEITITRSNACDHVYVGVVTRKPAVGSEGVKTYTCRYCSSRYTEKIPALSGGQTSEGQETEDASGDGQDAGKGGGQSTEGGSQTAGDGSSQPGNETKQGQKPGNGGKPQDPGKDQNGNPSGDTKPAGNKNDAKPGTGEENGNTSKDSKEKESGKPFIKGEDGKEGWQVIESWTDEAKEGDTIHVDMNGTTTVPGEIFDSIKGRDVTVTFDMGGSISWTVNGLTVTAQKGKTIDFGVTTGTKAGKTIPVEVINNVTGERYSINLTLSYEGEFGFTAVLTVNMDAANAGLYANLFYYNPESGALEFICAGQIDAEGNTNLTFTHASDYTIVIDTEPMDGQTKAEEETGAEAVKDAAEKAVDAGGADMAPEEETEAQDNGSIWIFISIAAVAVLAALGAVYAVRRKREENKK